MMWSLREVAEAVQGRLTRPVPAGTTAIRAVAIDSRTLPAGAMFVAIKAERDGHDYVQAAVSAGAVALLVDGRPTDWGVPAVAVDDTSAALLRLGRAARRRLPIPVVGITGSVGKTSTKDLAAAALATGMETVSSPRSFNNELGVPLTLANAAETCQVAVLEMGARGPGHVALLCSVAEPSVGVVTSVAAAHTETFGTLEAIAAAKGELVESLPASGTAVLNGDDRRVTAMAARGVARALFYSQQDPPAPGAEVVAEGVRLDDDLRPSFKLRSPWGKADVTLEARGVHQVGNALAALSVAAALGIDVGAAAGALRTAALSPWRMELERSRSGAAVLNDSYNANPASMAAALRALRAVPASRRRAVLGLMAELGDREAEEHTEMAELAESLGIEVIPVGTSLYGPSPAKGAGQVLARLGPIGSGDAILVKGSRVAGLEQVAAAILEG